MDDVKQLVDTIGRISNQRGRIVMKTLFLSMVLFILVAMPARAQQENPGRSYGDPSLEEADSAEVRFIYRHATGWKTVLTQENLLDLSKCRGIEITAGFVENAPRRILINAWTDKGKYAAEYYYRGDQLLFVYDTFEYYEDAAPPQPWRNFKGLPAWERRTYFKDGSPGYVVLIGNGIHDSLDDAPLGAERAKALLSLFGHTQALL